jgi:hypothetical protein
MRVDFVRKGIPVERTEKGKKGFLDNLEISHCSPVSVLGELKKGV